MASKVDKLHEGASSRQVQALIKDLTGDRYRGATTKEQRLWEELRALREQTDKLEQELIKKALADPEYRALAIKLEAADKAKEAATTKRVKELNKIRHRFQAEGPTNRVVAALNRLLDVCEEEI